MRDDLCHPPRSRASRAQNYRCKKRAGSSGWRSPLGESGRTRIHPAGSNHYQMSPAGSPHGGKGGRAGRSSPHQPRCGTTCKGCASTIRSAGRASNNRGCHGGSTNNDARRKTAGAYASDFYAGPVIPQGARRGLQHQVTEPEEDPMPTVGAALFTLPQRCAKARRPEQHPRLQRLWVCPAHRHR